MKEAKDATLHTRCPACGGSITWEGAVELDHVLECPRCGARGTVREFIMRNRREVEPSQGE